MKKILFIMLLLNLFNCNSFSSRDGCHWYSGRLDTCTCQNTGKKGHCGSTNTDPDMHCICD